MRRIGEAEAVYVRPMNPRELPRSARRRRVRLTVDESKTATCVARFKNEIFKKTSKRHRIGTAPRDAPFRTDSFEIPNEQHPKKETRRYRPSPRFVVASIVRRAQRFDRYVELRLVEDLRECLVEAVTTPARGESKHLFLLFFVSTHRHPHMRSHLIRKSDPDAVFTSAS
jgi:hypothetical protein